MIMVSRRLVLVVLLPALLGLGVVADTRPPIAGPTAEGFLLPNGWTISPVGRQVPLTDLPLNIIPLADGKRALVATSGYNKHELALIDLDTATVMQKETVRQSWYGLVYAGSAGSGRIWWSGGGADMLHTFQLQENKLTRTGPLEPAPEGKGKKDKAKAPEKINFRSGLLYDEPTHTLYSLDINTGVLSAQDTRSQQPARTAPCGVRPYDIVRGPNGALLYVSDWAGRVVLGVDPESLRVVTRIPVGEHPNQMVVHPRDDRLFVACASSNCVSVLDTRRGIVTETIMTALFPQAPEGSTPDALALTPDGQTLYVANADNNCIAVVDVATPGKSQVKGFIPTGWYPTSVAVTPDGKTLLVGVGRGNQTKANPIQKDAKPDKDAPDSRRTPYPYIGTTMSGALSIIAAPDDKQLLAYTAKVYRNCPYSDKLLSGAPSTVKTAIPSRVGDPSPIKYIIYIIKENRTYDQVFGDIKKGNGDPSLVMFGEEVTPNHHKLAEEFVLLDNLYCNGQVSVDGHPWSTMAYATDYISRDWQLTYSGRKGVKDDDDGDLSNAPSGYLWDACKRAGLTYRSYAEAGKRVSQPDGSSRMEARVPGLVGHMCKEYGVPRVKDQRARDTDNVEVFLREYHEFEKSGMPRFIVMSLGEDHTSGTTPGAFTPRSCVASNDLALGRLVDAVSHGKLWKETAIFVIEDDAQNGPDHVDAHRTVGLVISPYTRRHHVDSTQYSTVSMIRTIELILGLPPLSQYDAAARPMVNSFTDQADPTPYTHEKARIDLNMINTRRSYGAARSSRMDFSDYDLVDDFELNEILWRSLKGADAPLPPAVRRAIANRPVETR
jgi:YVTN family beta-propeller protein